MNKPKVTPKMVTNHEFMTIEGEQIHVHGYFYFSEADCGFVEVEYCGAYLDRDEFLDGDLAHRIDMLRRCEEYCTHYESLYDQDKDMMSEVGKAYPIFKVTGIMDIDDETEGTFLIQY